MHPGSWPCRQRPLSAHGCKSWWCSHPSDLVTYGTNVGARLKQAHGEAMPQGVHAHQLVNAYLYDRLFQSPLQALLVQMMSSFNTAARIERQRRRRKQPEPPPTLSQTRILGLQRIRHLHAAALRLPGVLPLRAQINSQRAQQHDHAVFVAFGLTHHDHAAIEVQILDPQAQALHQTHSPAAGDETDVRPQCRQQGHYLGHRQNRRDAPDCAWRLPPAAHWPAWRESSRSPAAPCRADGANRTISQTYSPTAHTLVPCAGYSVCNEFAHGPDPATVWRATQEVQWVSWQNLALFFCTAHLTQCLVASDFSHFLRPI